MKITGIAKQSAIYSFINEKCKPVQKMGLPYENRLCKSINT